MKLNPTFLAASDASGVIVVVFIIIVVAAVIKAASKPKGKWVYVEQKKGCVLMFALLGGSIFGSLFALLVRFLS